MRHAAMFCLASTMVLLRLAAAAALLDMTTPAEEAQAYDCHLDSSSANGQAHCQNMAMLQKKTVRAHTVLPVLSPKGSMPEESLLKAADLLKEVIETDAMPQLVSMVSKKVLEEADSSPAEASKHVAALSATHTAEPQQQLQSTAKKAVLHHKATKEAAAAEKALAEKAKKAAQEAIQKASEKRAAAEVAAKRAAEASAAAEAVARIAKKEQAARKRKSRSAAVARANKKARKEDVPQAKSKISSAAAVRAEKKTQEEIVPEVRSKSLFEAPELLKPDTEEFGKELEAEEPSFTMASFVDKEWSNEDEDEQGNPKNGAKKESAAAPPVIDGSRATLDEKGFKQVVRLHDTDSMKTFIRRVVRKAGLFITDQDGLKGAAAFFTKRRGGHKYSALTDKIFTAASKPGSWVSLVASGSKAGMTELSSLPAKQRPRLGPGLTAPLNQDGYLRVASLKKGAEMNIFIQRVINRLGLTVKDRFGLQGLVPWYSGENATQSYGALQMEILNAAMKTGQWVSSDAPLL